MGILNKIENEIFKLISNWKTEREKRASLKFKTQPNELKEFNHVFDIYDHIADMLDVNPKFFLILLNRFESRENYEQCVSLRDYLTDKCRVKNIQLEKDEAIIIVRNELMDCTTKGIINSIIMAENLEKAFQIAEDIILKHTHHESNKANLHRNRP